MVDTEEMWRSWIGKKGPVIYAAYEASRTAIAYFCEATQDANPLYHDEEYATNSRHGGIICPPTMLYTLGQAPTWVPKGEVPRSALLAADVPLDCRMLINVTVEQEFYLPMRPGDRLHSQSEIVDITPKTNRLGFGYFVTEEVTYWNQKNEKVAVVRNRMFRYGPSKE